MLPGTEERSVSEPGAAVWASSGQVFTLQLSPPPGDWRRLGLETRYESQQPAAHRHREVCIRGQGSQEALEISAIQECTCHLSDTAVGTGDVTADKQTQPPVPR